MTTRELEIENQKLKNEVSQLEKRVDYLEKRVDYYRKEYYSEVVAHRQTRIRAFDEWLGI